MFKNSPVGEALNEFETQDHKASPLLNSVLKSESPFSALLYKFLQSESAIPIDSLATASLNKLFQLILELQLH